MTIFAWEELSTFPSEVGKGQRMKSSWTNGEQKVSWFPPKGLL